MKAIIEGTTFSFNVPQGFRITPEQFEQLAEAEQTARLELTEHRELIVMSLTGGTAGKKNFNLYLDLGNWNRQNKLGEAFDSSTIFILPNGARRSPDVSWIKLERWNELTKAQQDGFPPITPDFAIELVSPSDLRTQQYRDLQNKMQEYSESGVRLGWLIEPLAKKVEIYRAGKKVEILNNPKSLSGENILPGFTLDLAEIFTA